MAGRKRQKPGYNAKKANRSSPHADKSSTDSGRKKKSSAVAVSAGLAEIVSEADKLLFKGPLRGSCYNLKRLNG